MTVTWYSRGIRDWRNAGIDWLCLRAAPGPMMMAVEFEEGTHHHFDGLFLIDTKAYAEGHSSGGLVWHASIAEPDPIGVTDSDMLHHGADAILLRVRFCRPTRAPFSRGTESKEICCGRIWRDDGSKEPFIMQFMESSQSGTQTAVPPRWRDAAAVLLAPAEAAVVPRLKRFSGRQNRFGFQLMRPTAKDVQVYVLDREPLRAMSVGEEVDLSIFADTIERVIIPRGTHMPSTTVEARDGSLAVPVQRLNVTRGLVGYALPLRQPIGGLVLEKVDNAMLVSWRWTGPQNWIAVHLRWMIVDDEGRVWADERGQESVYERSVSASQFKNRRNREVAILSDWPGWTLRMTATPVIQGEPVAEFAQHTQLRM